MMKEDSELATITTWHAMKEDEVLRSLQSDLKGLTKEEVELRLQKFGYNELEKPKRVSPLQIFLSQFKNIFVIMLLGAIIISAIVGWYETQISIEPRLALESYVDAIAIGAIVILNAIVGFVQEYRSEKAMEAMEKLTAPKARLLRAGKEIIISAKEVVPGDILLVETGDRIAADGRLLEAVDLSINEAILTGESASVDKNTSTLSSATAVSDRKNMVFMGTHITQGRGKVIVTSTGMNTQFGKIAKMMQVVEKEEIPLKLKLDSFAKKLGIIVVIASLVVIALELIRLGTIEIETFMTSVALAVSAVPEGLPAIVTVTLALGARELSKQNAVIRKLASVETLGSTTVICSDKTGTLTKGEMTVKKIFVNNQMLEITGTGYDTKGEFYRHGNKIEPTEDKHIDLILKMGLLCNNADYDGTNIVGDPTEGALIVVAFKAGINKNDLQKQYPRIGEITFSSERKRMTTIHKMPNGQKVAYIKGSPEMVLQLCDHVYQNNREKKLDQKSRTEILAKNEEMANQALRVLGLAYKIIPDQLTDYNEEKVENNFVFVGIIGMIDPPREEARDAVELCGKAGIRTIMITGDHKLTATAIGKEIGLTKNNRAFTGKELDGLSEEEFEKVVEEVAVYARVSPDHKLRIVRALKKKGHIVAMTGDGVNDAPALKQADIGVAMGITGTDVTKEASDMILADDNFATIVNAVRGGRLIFDNIRKFIRFLVSVNFVELVLVGSFAIIGLPLPLLPAMLLWINLVTDGPPAMALSMDPPIEDVMQRPPRSPKEGVLHGMATFMFSSSLILFVALVGAFWWGINFGGSVEKARTMVFLVTCFYQLVVVWNCRSESRNAFKVGFLTNKWLLIAVIVSVLSTIATIYVPPLQFMFQTVTLDLFDWILVVFFASWGFFVIPEIFMKRRQTLGLKAK
ncbi:MAG: cation-translocating P-type ATPase [Candidatus Bathyarchaeota archaeon]|nr:MAG: cation-translocating P-type ATPase [Candidatus Bathyarchaeota archaeon]